jgi:UDPglucose--hexose-1-phosphate uridylyltransferase
VRVVPNLDPIVGGDDARPGATGAHEVVVLSPDHDKSFAQLAPDQAVDVMRMLRDRVRAHTAAGHVYVQAFVNHGRAAGASIEHPHAQVVALDFVPPAVTGSLARYGDAGGDLVVDTAVSARHDERVVLDGDVVVWCPYAPSAPYETTLAHRDAGACFADATDDQVGEVVRALQDVLTRVASVAGDPPYNVVIHSAPGRNMGDAVFHWWIEVSPRLSLYAGFELGTGVLVATTPPEQAAAELRD